MSGFSDEQTVRHWVENFYWQYFCGFDILQWKPPIDPSLMSHFRKRIGKEGITRFEYDEIIMSTFVIGHCVPQKDNCILIFNML